MVAVKRKCCDALKRRTPGGATFCASLHPIAAMEEAPTPPQSAPQRMNANVKLALIYYTAFSMCASLMSGTQLAAFILLVSRDAHEIPRLPGSNTSAMSAHADDNFAVGVATGVQGVVNLLCAMPAGIAADRFGRQRVLRFASVVGLLVSAYWAFCFVYVRPSYSVDTLYYSLVGATAGFGVFFGLHSSPLDALFADSIESGTRSKLYSWRTSLRTAANAIGPAVSVAVFLTLGDDWSESELVLVILIGVGGFVLPALMLLLFRDSATLGTESEALTSVVAPLPPAPLPPVATAGSTLTLLGSDVPAASTPCAPPPLTEAQQLATALVSRRACGVFGIGSIAPLVALSDFLTMLGSGMTIKFFALFFWRGLALGPVLVSALYVVGPLGISVGSLLAQRLSLRLGRLQVTLLCKFGGVTLLVAMGCLDLHAQGAAYYVIPIYLLRTWLMNCTSGLTKSVLNDYVPKKDRAKWNALESLNVFSWSGR